MANAEDKLLNQQLGNSKKMAELTKHIEVGKMYKLHTHTTDRGARNITFKAKAIRFKQAESLLLLIADKTQQAMSKQKEQELK